MKGKAICALSTEKQQKLATIVDNLRLYIYTLSCIFMQSEARRFGRVF
jgi:hypothetical protein